MTNALEMDIICSVHKETVVIYESTTYQLAQHIPCEHREKVCSKRLSDSVSF